MSDRQTGGTGKSAATLRRQQMLAQMTPSQLAAYRARQVERERKRRETMTPEKLAARREYERRYRADRKARLGEAGIRAEWRRKRAAWAASEDGRETVRRGYRRRLRTKLAKQGKLGPELAKLGDAYLPEKLPERQAARRLRWDFRLGGRTRSECETEQAQSSHEEWLEKLDLWEIELRLEAEGMI